MGNAERVIIKVNNPENLVRAFQTLPVYPVYFDVNLHLNGLPLLRELNGEEDVNSYLAKCEERKAIPMQARFMAHTDIPFTFKSISDEFHGSRLIATKVTNHLSSPGSFAEVRFDGEEYQAWQKFARDIIPIWSTKGYEVANGTSLTLSVYGRDKATDSFVRFDKSNLEVYAGSDTTLLGLHSTDRLMRWARGLKYLEK